MLEGIDGGMPEAERERLLHDRLVQAVSYDTGLDKPNIYNAYGAIVDRVAVCEGYARAMPVSYTHLAKGGNTIFCREDGSAWSVDNFRDHFKRCLETIGTRVLTPHATRRTFSTRLSASGVRPEDIIALMAVSYTHLDVYKRQLIYCSGAES